MADFGIAITFTRYTHLRIACDGREEGQDEMSQAEFKLRIGASDKTAK
jgi:hypothetical protein